MQFILLGMQSLYSVPIVPLNLRKEETIVQIAEVVQYLSDVVDDVLTRVNRRVEDNDKKLNDIAARIGAANNKVCLLTGAKKATQVFSSSKYPADNINRPYISVFARNTDPLVITRNSLKCASATPSDAPLETLQFYHVKSKTQENELKTSGLGNPPDDITSFNEIILYNTGKNVYSKYEMSDTLDVSHWRQSAEEKESAADIGAAPLSITFPSTTNKTNAGTFSYTPNLGDVPTIDVPLDLPDLPGIADDLRYTTQIDTAIAPSVTTTPNIPDLPPIFDDLPPIENENITHHPEPPQPPPPPPPVFIPQPAVEELPEKETTEILPPDEKKEPVQLAPPPLAASDQIDMHASLMEAIRKAGGSKNAKLKSTDAKRSEDATPAPKVIVEMYSPAQTISASLKYAIRCNFYVQACWGELCLFKG